MNCRHDDWRHDWHAIVAWKHSQPVTHSIRFCEKLARYDGRQENRLLLHGGCHAAVCGMVAASGKGNAMQATPNQFGPQDPYACLLAIVSLTTCRTMHTTMTTSGAITADDELLRTLRAMEQENSRLPLEISKIFARVMKPFLDVHRRAAQ